MIPLKLVMKNFLSYEEETFDFGKITNAVVVGENGAGKSSFCTDAIVWALFGIASKGGVRDGVNYVHEGADSCTVQLTFAHNDKTYKVIRSFSIAKGGDAKLFVISDDGDEIPLSAKASDVVKEIEHLIHMNYKTFVSSSMMLQNDSSEFTEHMTDMERKEALINILNVGEWDKMEDVVSDDLADVKNSIQMEKLNREHYAEVIEKESSLLEEKATLGKQLETILARKRDKQEFLDANQEAVYKIKSLQDDIDAGNREIKEAEIRIQSNSSQITSLQNKIYADNQSIERYKHSIDNASKLLDNKDKIEACVEQEKKLSEEIQSMSDLKMAILQKNNDLQKLTQTGKDWNARRDNEVAVINTKIENAQKQAQYLNSVPCASTPSMNRSCPFLKMANEAKNALNGLYTQLDALKKRVNPHRSEWAALHKEVKDMEAKFSEEQLARLQTELAEAHKYAMYAERLHVAADTINQTTEIINSTKQMIQSAKQSIDGFMTENTSLKAKVSKKKADIETLSSTLKSFASANSSIALAKDEIAALEREEKEVSGRIASNKTLLEQVATTKAKNDESLKKDKELFHKKMLLEKMLEACGKKSGVPSLVIENAVPELENTANKMLENMLNGRLQVRLDTQAEYKSVKDRKADVLRITVLDNGYPRKYETYSGAEKFMVDLSLRIAMSKFLAHRAGAKVQIFVLDEGVSCADENSRNEIVEAIKGITKEFEKVLFITHIDELKDILDDKILVNKDSMGSHIRIQK